jgi:predicted transcriptional regulator
MASKRWDKNEKAELIKLYSSGDDHDKISKKLNRSESAIRLRIQSIIYDGIAKGMKISDLVSTLKIDRPKIVQMFYTHVDFKEARNETVMTSEEIDKAMGIGIGKRRSSHRTPTVDVIDKLTDCVKSSKASKSEKYLTTELDIVTNQNKVMEAIINNREYRKKIKKLYKDGKLSDTEKQTLEKILTE